MSERILNLDKEHTVSSYKNFAMKKTKGASRKIILEREFYTIEELSIELDMTQDDLLRMASEGELELRVFITTYQGDTEQFILPGEYVHYYISNRETAPFRYILSSEKRRRRIEPSDDYKENFKIDVPEQTSDALYSNFIINRNEIKILSKEKERLASCLHELHNSNNLDSKLIDPRCEKAYINLVNALLSMLMQKEKGTKERIYKFLKKEELIKYLVDNFGNEYGISDRTLDTRFKIEEIPVSKQIN